MKKLTFTEWLGWTLAFCSIYILIDLFFKKRKEEETK